MLEVVARTSAPLPSSPSPSPAATEWSPLRRLVFRFGAIYWSLFILAEAMSQSTVDYVIGEPIAAIWVRVCAFVGRHVLRIERQLPLAPNGSGDHTTSWIGVLIIATVATVGSLAWTSAARRREYVRLQAWLRVVLRYQLAFIILGYGLCKLSQFGLPDADDLSETYGESSPMRLLWTFMGASPAYSIFAGVGETVGALLLLSRRTVTLGALLLIAVLSNVVMLNLCYDVCVKIDSAHYLVMAMVLLAPDLNRLADVLVRQRPTTPVPWQRQYASRRQRLAHHVVKFGLIATALWQAAPIHGELKARFAASKSEVLDGAWLVTRFVRNGQELPARPGDPLRWRALFFDTSHGGLDTSWRLSDGSFGPRRLSSVIDATAHTLTMTTSDEPKRTMRWAFSRPDADHVRLSGTIDGSELTVEAERGHPERSPLMTRGFHFINESPYSR